MPRSSVIDRDPSRRLHTGPQNVARLGHKPLLAPVEKPRHLAFRDVHPDIAQQTHQAANGHLAAVILGQYEALHLRPEVTAEPRRQRRHHHPAIGGEPALSPVADHVRTQHKILNHTVLVVLETRAVRNRDLDDPILAECGNTDLPLLGAAPPLAGPCARGFAPVTRRRARILKSCPGGPHGSRREGQRSGPL